MLEKTKNMLTLILLGGFICVLSLTCILKKPQAISYSERRKLAQFPQISIESMQSGQFTQEFERYASDQFPLRDTFLQLNVHYAKDILRKKDINQLYIRTKDAIAMEYPLHRLHCSMRQNYGKAFNRGILQMPIMCIIPSYRIKAIFYPMMNT